MAGLPPGVVARAREIAGGPARPDLPGDDEEGEGDDVPGCDPLGADRQAEQHSGQYRTVIHRRQQGRNA